jgi:Fic family protein
MIKEKKEPKTFGEKMIFNNFATMKAIQEKYKDEKLSLDMLFDMHAMLTKDVLEKESEQGSFRTNEDKIVIQKGDDQSVVSYVTPSIEFVQKEIKKLIAFANDELEEKDFIHPVIKAIMLHFWIGLLHPFVDGNGRLARGLFYWYLLRKGYWAFALLPISLVIKKSPSQYADAYILSEQDDNDLTYFIDYNLSKINQAIENFRKYFSVKSKENSKKEEILHHYKNLNIRQIEALKNLSENPDKSLTLTTHKNIFGVTKMTAIKDLKGLLNAGFVTSAKQGRNVFYRATKKLDELQF